MLGQYSGFGQIDVTTILVGKAMHAEGWRVPEQLGSISLGGLVVGKDR